MPEEFIQYIWENELFYQKNLKTTAGEKLEIIYPGKRNSDSGPDFFNAKIKIGNTIWAGNIEIHKKSSDWNKHRHKNDRAYDNVILHVVWKNDLKIFRSNGSAVPAVKLTWPDQYSQNYKRLLNAKTWIPCQEIFQHIDPLFIRLGFHGLMIERLRNKTNAITKVMGRTKNNWNETFYQMLARMLGFKINALPFELLSNAVPVKILEKHKNNLIQLESLLFGASGMLAEDDQGDEYYKTLQKEFNFLSKKYRLKAMEVHLWKFMRLRPANFPTIRISQLAALIYHSQGLFSQIIAAEKIKDLQKLFEVKASDYWNSHYRFNTYSNFEYQKKIGTNSINTLIINVIVPFLFIYGDTQNKNQLKDRALDFLEKLPPENNAIIRKWKNTGVEPKTAFDTQALLQLKTMHCERKKCLNCPIGNKIIKIY